jgi:hypothetical protein
MFVVLRKLRKRSRKNMFQEIVRAFLEILCEFLEIVHASVKIVRFSEN